MPGRLRVGGVVAVVIAVAVAVAFTLLSTWLVETPRGKCAVVRGMSRDAVVSRCGPPADLVWHPPDYRDASLLYSWEYMDIDYALCPGAGFVYEDSLVVFKWEGGVATVEPAAEASRHGVVNEEALLGCGPRIVSDELSRIGRPSEARAALLRLASESPRQRTREAASEVLRQLFRINPSR